VHDDLVADLDVGDVLADGIHDARGVAAADVEALRLACLVAGADDVDRDAEAGPHVVVVDAGCHDVDEHLVVGDRRDIDDLLLEGLQRRAEALRADQPGMHLRGDLAQGRLLAQVVEFLGHRGSSLQRRAARGLSGQRWRSTTRQLFWRSSLDRTRKPKACYWAQPVTLPT
jgi:hypothetical protein